MLHQALAGIVGADHVLADEAARRYASSDIFVWPDAVVADLVVRPGSTEETARVAQALNGKSIVPRGAGLSYTAGVVPHQPAVVVDTARMDAIDIHADDLYAVVGAGCTWEKLALALKPHGLHAVQRSPISGSHSTVGGAASPASTLLAALPYAWSMPKARMPGAWRIRVAMAPTISSPSLNANEANAAAGSGARRSTTSVLMPKAPQSPRNMPVRSGPL